MSTNHPCLVPNPSERRPLVELIARLEADRWWETPRPHPDYRLFDLLGRPITCPHCGHADCWQPQAHPADHHVYAFICHHVPCTADSEPLGHIGTAYAASIATCEVARQP